MCALECWRKGHNVVKIFERHENPVYTGQCVEKKTLRFTCIPCTNNHEGDCLNLMPSAMSIFRHWPDACREIESEHHDCMMSYYKHNGEHIYGPMPPIYNDPENKKGRRGPHCAFQHRRVNLYRTFLKQVARIGLRVDYGCTAKSYFEDENAGKAGVVLENGDVFLADVVVVYPLSSIDCASGGTLDNTGICCPFGLTTSTSILTACSLDLFLEVLDRVSSSLLSSISSLLARAGVLWLMNGGERSSLYSTTGDRMLPYCWLLICPFAMGEFSKKSAI